MKTVLFAMVMGLSLLVGAATTQAAQVGINLYLLVDVSGSVSTSEFNLQKTGYVNAFNSPAVHAAIAGAPSGTDAKLAVTLIYWSSATFQDVAVEWFEVSNATESNALASAINATTRPFSGGTVIGSALEFATDHMNDADAPSSLWTIFDVSGDGQDSSGTASAQGGRDYALDNGVDVINGIVIGSSALKTWYENNVIGGTDPFAVQVSTFSDFAGAVENKIIQEIQNAPQVVPLPAAVWSGMALLGGMGLLRRRRLI